MASVKMVVIKTGTIIRNIKMEGSTIDKINQVACTLESIISEDLKILKIEVDYEGSNDSQTIEGYNP